MSTEAQIKSNIENAKLSTGPVTPDGKSASSQNHLITGLYTRRDFVKPEERGIYKEFCDALTAELGPFTFLEGTHVSEIIAAAWRLRRCQEVEGDLAETAAITGMEPVLLKAKLIHWIGKARAHQVLYRRLGEFDRTLR